jgi:hypothetical protein
MNGVLLFSVSHDFCIFLFDRLIDSILRSVKQAHFIRINVDVPSNDTDIIQNQ